MRCWQKRPDAGRSEAERNVARAALARLYAYALAVLA